jgi:hypothetical protein
LRLRETEFVAERSEKGPDPVLFPVTVRKRLVYSIHLEGDPKDTPPSEDWICNSVISSGGVSFGFSSLLWKERKDGVVDEYGHSYGLAT